VNVLPLQENGLVASPVAVTGWQAMPPRAPEKAFGRKCQHAISVDCREEREVGDKQIKSHS